MSSVPKIPDHITGKEIARHNKLLNEISASLRALSEEDQFLIDNIMKMTSGILGTLLIIHLLSI